MRDLNDLVGRRVVAFHQDTGGVVVEVHPGCNPTIRVQLDGRKFDSIHPPQDLVFAALWPSNGARLSDWLNGA